jgi:NADPH:quinone reductase-like Zn-dependent oxidoreductase
MDSATAFWTVGAGRGELRREALGPPADGEVLIHTLFSGVSRGSEALVFQGRVPPSEYPRMRAPFQQGEFPAPVKYGYASVGRVLAGPAALLDAIVFCLHPHQDRYCVPLTAVQPLTEGVPPARAILAANMETALNAVWDADVQPGARVAVIGAGSVGCLVASLVSRIAGCEVQLIDRNPLRAAVAARLGVPFATPESARDGVDHVLHASGHAEGLRLALRLAGDEACITELSWYGDRSVSLPLGEAFHSRRLTIRASQVGVVARSQRAHFTRGQRLALALTLLRDPALDALIDSECRFSELPAVMPGLLSESGTVIMHRVRYE